MQLLFIRKEIENKTVRKARLWSRNQRKGADLPVSLSEIDAIQEQMEKNTPWTPWRKAGGD